jgi:predicted nucleic acid-binding protein
MRSNDPILFDAGLFIGALLRDDPRHPEAYPWLKQRGEDL